LNTYLITGGTGTLGTALTKLLLSQGHKVRVLARNEHGHERLERSIPQDEKGRLSCLVGAVEDESRLLRAMRGADYVIHAAAQKIIPTCEYNPIEAVQTNIQGTINTLNACLEAGIKRAVLVSTDKASSPATLYGGTKFVAERLWLNANRYSAGKEPHFVAVRYGNVWMSQGSVIHTWVKQAQYGVISITDPQCTRFHITLENAVAFVLSALHQANPGELWVPRLPSYRLGDLGLAFRQVYNLSKQPEITGLRRSEKLHESMISQDESPSLKGEAEGHYILEPGVIHNYVPKDQCQGHPVKPGKFQYDSCRNLDVSRLGVEELTEEIREWVGHEKRA